MGSEMCIRDSCITIPTTNPNQRIPDGTYLVRINTDYNMGLGRDDLANDKVYIYVTSSSQTRHDGFFWAVKDGDLIDVFNDTTDEVPVYLFFADNYCDDNIGSAEVTLEKQ